MKDSKKSFDFVSASAPGKLLIIGDHAAVYGYPCISTAVDKRLVAIINKTNADKNTIATSSSDKTFVEKALGFFNNKFNINGYINIEIKSGFSDNVGLGSSAAVTTSLLFALYHFYRIPVSLPRLFQDAYTTHSQVQKNGSGFDIATTIYGKTILYSKGLEKIRYLNGFQKYLVIGYSGTKAKTKEFVDKVNNQFRNNRPYIHDIFQKMNSLVVETKSLLVKRNYQKIGTVLTGAHNLLQQLNVSTPRLDDMVTAAIEAGAWGAKLSGAGGGDCMIAIAPENKKQDVKTAIVEAGGQIIDADTNCKGVTIEKYG